VTMPEARAAINVIAASTASRTPTTSIL
jgi:hypothetical protein